MLSTEALFVIIRNEPSENTVSVVQSEKETFRQFFYILHFDFFYFLYYSYSQSLLVCKSCGKTPTMQQKKKTTTTMVIPFHSLKNWTIHIRTSAKEWRNEWWKKDSIPFLRKQTFIFLRKFIILIFHLYFLLI